VPSTIRDIAGRRVGHDGLLRAGFHDCSMELSPQGRLLLERRYLLPGETPDGLFSRVADLVGGPARSREFFSLISSLRFLPNSPTLMNAGTASGQLSACFVLPVEDTLEGIFRSL